MSESPVSDDEPSPGSLCDLARRRNPSPSLLTLTPSFSLFPALRRRYSGWCGRAGPLPPLCSLAAEEDEVGGTEEAGAAPWRKGVEGRTRISGIEDRCWEVEPPIASSWEQLLANMAWWCNTGDLENNQGRVENNISVQSCASYRLNFGFYILYLISQDFCSLKTFIYIINYQRCLSSLVCGGGCAGWRAGVGPLSSEETPGPRSSCQRALWCLRLRTMEVDVVPAVSPLSPFNTGPVAPLSLVS